MSDEEIINEVKKYKARQIVLTGGEPSLFIDDAFINDLKKSTGMRIAIETNGTNPLPKGIDWVTVSPKEGINISGDAGLSVDYADELKVVDCGQPLESYFTLKCVKSTTVMLLQPCYLENPEKSQANIKKTISRVLEDPRWRLSLQSHKMLGIR